MNSRALYRQDRGFWRALPVAVLGWVLALWGVGHFLSAPGAPEDKPEVVEEKIVELPPEAQAAAPRTQAPPPSQAPSPQPAPPPPVAQPPAPPPPAQAESKPQPVSAPPPPPPVATPAAAPVAGVETHGPVALSQPDPVLPDELLDQVAGQTITVRALIGADGSLSVDIPDRAIDPRIRKSIVEQLKRNWRFSPAMQAGKPVSMAQDFSFSF